MWVKYSTIGGIRTFTSEEENYDWTSVWVLASIYLAQKMADQDVRKVYKKMVFPEHLTKYKNLYKIVYAGDFINQAIFTDDELLYGIDRLSKAGFIEEKKDSLLPTSKLNKLYKEATINQKSVSRDAALRIFAYILQTKLPWE